MANISPVNALQATVAAAITSAQAGDRVLIPSTAATAGTWTVTFNGQTTGALAYNISAASLQTALQLLSTVGSGNVTVTKGNPEWVIEFIGTKANSSQNAFTVTPTGITPAYVMSVRQTPAGSAGTSTFVAHNCIQRISFCAPYTAISTSAALTINKAIQVTGATTVEGTKGTYDVTNLTIIQCNLPDSIGVLISPSSDQLHRVSGISFVRGASTAQMKGAIRTSGTGHTVRVDHCYFETPPYGLYVDGDVLGVCDHCQFIPLMGSEYISVNHKDWRIDGNLIVGLGHGSYADDPRLGSNSAWFVEDCEMLNFSTNINRGAQDGQAGGRGVMRHSYWFNCLPTNHETKQSRGQRVLEVYNNTMACTIAGAPRQNQIRSGTGLWHSNALTGYATSSRPLEIYAMVNGSAIFGDDQGGGAGPWDSNVGGLTPTVFDSGTASATSPTGSYLFTDSTKTWTTNQWITYSITNVRTGQHSTIDSNTSTSMLLTGRSNHDTSPTTGTVLFVAGDAYRIYKVVTSVDQPGRGKCDLIVGTGVTGSGQARISGTIIGTPEARVFPHQALEPIYSWLNTLDGNPYPVFIGSSLYTHLENRDYYNQAVAVGGAQTVGVGVGLRAARPSNCTAGVGYWATDESKLYVASATNTWALFYQPYTYPHPFTLADNASTKIISLSGVGSTLAFGNVLVGKTKARSFLISNLGDSTLTVTSVTYPSGYTGAFSGTIAAGASQIVAVTFSPVLAQDYTGTLTVNSDATGGINTLLVTGKGVAAATSSGGNGIRGLLGRRL